MFFPDTWEVSLSGSHARTSRAVDSCRICCRMCCGSIPSGSGLSLLQRGFKELESHDHTCWCSFISAGSTTTTQSPGQPISHGKSSWHCWFLLTHPHFPQTQPGCAQLVPTTSPPKIKHQHQQTTTLGHAWETPAGLLSPSKLQTAHSSAGMSRQEGLSPH